jgi:1-acyl-sn-glycerol-3-phosphate acyltransferase
MNVVAGLAREYWIRTWKMRQAYHRFEVKGVEVLEGPGPAIIAGYHGRPFASDLLMLQIHMLDRSVSCRPLVHDSFAKSRFFRPIVEGMGFLTGEGPELDRAVAQGAKIIITPGGGQESTRASSVRYRSHWEGRIGFARLALRKRLPIIPAAGSGVDDQYLSLIDGYRTARSLGLPRKMMLFVGVGPLGLFPFSPPFPVKVTLHLGRPIPPEGDPDSEADVRALHARVVGAVEVLLDRAREESCAAVMYQPEDATWV